MHVADCRGALLTPIQRHPGRLRRLLSNYGMHDAEGERLPAWQHLTSLDTTYARAGRRPLRAEFEALPGRWIYAGVFWDTFGHFVTETLPNLFAAARVLKEAPGAGILFFLPPNWLDAPRRPGLSDLHAYLIDLAGLDPTTFAYVDRPLRVETLVLGETPFPRKYRYAPWLLQAIDDTLRIRSEPARRLYLSRSRWPRPRLLDEPELEGIFVRHGYEVVHLQELPIRDQLDLVCGAGHLAGPQGTALHWSLFAPGCRSVLSLGWPSPLQRGICLSRGQTYAELRGRKPSLTAGRLRAVSAASIQRALGNLA